jgi:tetratricopeptide (TPR) repeat protein
MRIIITLLICACSFNVTAQSLNSARQYQDNPSAPSFNYQRDFLTILERTKNRSDVLYYDSLLVRFKNNDTTLTRSETLALLIGYTDNQFYDPMNDMEKEKEIFNLNEAGEYEEAMKECEKYLKKHPVSLKVLKEMSFVYNQIGKLDSARYYMDLVEKIMNAMIFSGKGKTPENPIFSLALDDGEQFIPNVGMTIAGRKTGTNANNHFMEIINARTDEGVNINYFFVIQHAMDKAEGRDLLEAPVKKPKKGKKGSKDVKKEEQKEELKEEIKEEVKDPSTGEVKPPEKTEEQKTDSLPPPKEEVKDDSKKD